MAPGENDKKSPPEDLEAFGKKLEKARESEDSRKVWGADADKPPQSALGLAFRVAVEVVSALAVGLAIGWALDHWLGTRPWLMIVFLVLGGAAGVLNVYRLAIGMSRQMGYQKRETVGTETSPEEGKDRSG